MTRHLSYYFAVALLALAGLLVPSSMMADTTIRLDKNSSHPLYADGAQGNDRSKQFFGFVRHDVTHVQMISNNSPTLSTDGSGVFNNFANNFLYGSTSATTSELGIYCGDPEDGYDKGYGYVAIVAPKGYRFTSYTWDFDGTNSTNGTEVIRYNMGEGSDIQVTSESMTISSSSTTFSNAISNGGNILYFRFHLGYTQSGSTYYYRNVAYMKSLTLTYVIDQPFSGEVPSAEFNTQLHTGLLDLGEFSNNGLGAKYWSFKKRRVHDLQELNVRSGSNLAKDNHRSGAIVDGKNYVVASEGDYYVEAPTKFRIVGATISFLSREEISGPSFTESATDTWEETSSIADRGRYRIAYSGTYLNISDVSLTQGTDASSATEWTFSKEGNGYYIKVNGHYLYVYNSNGYKLALYSSGSPNGRYIWKFEDGKLCNDYGCYLQYDGEKWTITSTSQSATDVTLYQRTAHYTGGSYNATVFNREGKDVADNGSLSLGSDNTTGTVELNDLNNDAIHFNISNLADGQVALYNVSLKLMPLNPEVEELSVASKLADGNVVSNTSSRPVNYQFNDGDNVELVVPKGKDSYNVVFRNANNPLGTAWYTDGNSKDNGSVQGAYSNYFLVNSGADKGEGDDVSLNVDDTGNPTARIEASEAGTNKLYFTNIVEFDSQGSSGPNRLSDNVFKKTDAGYAPVSLTPNAAAGTYYVYSADEPTFYIMPKGVRTQHIDFRYYTINLTCRQQSEKPGITLVPIYRSTMKGDSRKGSVSSDGKNLDETRTYYGIKVKAELGDGETGTALGYLLSTDVADAIKAAVKDANYDTGFDEDHVLGGALYIDLSSLKSIDIDAFDAAFDKSTADNCLYFMYPGFSGGSYTNVVARPNANEPLQAVRDIVLKDQQPFFTPYDFSTKTWQVKYTREGTNGKALVSDATIVLPFSIKLDEKGHPYTSADVVNTDITFRNITGFGETMTPTGTYQGEPVTYAFTADGVTTGQAKANTPYHINNGNGVGFEFSVKDAQFEATPCSGTDEVTVSDMTNTVGDWTAHGNYHGLKIKDTDADWSGAWYFASDYYWCASKLSTYSDVNIRPFRAYYVTTGSTPAKVSVMGVAYNRNDVVTGISSHASNDGLQVATGNGFISVKADSPTPLRVYSVAGQLVADGSLAAGESRSVNVPAGVYVVNSVKVVVK